MNTREVKTIVSPTGRSYVAAKDVAAVCCLSEYELDVRYRPDDWATPRDFKLTPAGVLLFALASLPRFADALHAAGQPDAALRLREWIVPAIETALAESAPPRGSQERKDWMARWEGEHDL